MTEENKLSKLNPQDVKLLTDLLETDIQRLERQILDLRRQADQKRETLARLKELPSPLKRSQLDTDLEVLEAILRDAGEPLRAGEIRREYLTRQRKPIAKSTLRNRLNEGRKNGVFVKQGDKRTAKWAVRG